MTQGHILRQQPIGYGVAVELRRFFVFFQAEDGIRDIGVTGVQTCALPICSDSATLFPKCSMNPGRGSLLTRDALSSDTMTSTANENCRLGTSRSMSTNPRDRKSVV